MPLQRSASSHSDSVLMSLDFRTDQLPILAAKSPKLVDKTLPEVDQVPVSRPTEKEEFVVNQSPKDTNVKKRLKARA